MCQAMHDNGDFDPALCPLLKGLPPEAIARRMRDDPVFARCKASIAESRDPARAMGGKPATCMLDETASAG